MAKTITLEEHFVTADFLKAAGSYGQEASSAMTAMREKLLDLGPARIAAMDEGSIDLQVLSLAAMGGDELAPAQQTAVFRSVNDEAAAAVKANPTRLASFATVALKQPTEAAKEVERSVTQLGCKGIFVDGTTTLNGEIKFLDAPEFFPVLEAAVALDVPVYLHPAPPPKIVEQAYYSNLPGETGHLLSIAGWGWHAETGLHVLRMVVAGIFDRFPTLQLIVGHMGEFIPYALARSNRALSAASPHLKRSVTQTLLDQVHITTSGYFTREPFDCCRAVVGLDRMMYSVDYPFSPNTRGKEFLQSLELSPEEMDAFRGDRAATLLKLPVA
jgi:predicted TIM-barrel fold metal-dependent hydrolase